MSNQHFIADIPQKAILAQNGRVLITRDLGATHWELPGGRLHEDEDPISGLKRELLEELSLPVEPLRIFDVAAFISASGQRHFAVIYLCALADPEPVIRKQEDEIADYRWVTAQDLAGIPFAAAYAAVLAKYFAEAGS